MGSVYKYFLDEEKTNATKIANVVSSFAGEYIESDNLSIADEFSSYYSTFLIDEKYNVSVYNKDSVLIFSSLGEDGGQGKIHLEESVLTALGGTPGNAISKDEKTGYDVINVSVPIKQGDDVIAAVNVSLATNKMWIFFSAIRDELVVLAILSCLLIGLVIFVVANLMTRRIVRFTDKITMMSDGILDEKMDIKGNDEIARMGEAFNTMAEKLAGIEQQRIQFVSDASHELKTPLSSIKLMSDSIVQNPDIPKEQIHEFLSDINNEVDRLNRIINKLLSITKMDTDAEKNENNFELLELRGVVSDIVKTLYPLAKNSEIALNFIADSEVYIIGDKDTLFQAIYNIADNAIKYTKRYGEVNIIVESKDGEAHIVVRDNGVGMRQEDTEHIFERFYRVDKARARETGGTGLGLAIANAAVKSHNGTIRVFSEPNMGSEFTIVLPLANIENA